MRKAPASSCIEGIAWRYWSSVIDVVAWPSHSETTLVGTPAWSESVAAEWRMSWNRIEGRPAARTSRSKAPLTASGCRGVPSSRTKT